MAEYRITGWNGQVTTRKQKPAAFQAYQLAVWHAIKAQAGLDTHWGIRAMATSEGAAENTRRHETRVRDHVIKFERIA